MKEIYASLFFSLLGSMVLCRLVGRSLWLANALRNLSPYLYVFFALGFPLFLLGPVVQIYTNDYTIFTVLYFLFVCVLFLYMILYFYRKRESEEVYTWLLLNTKIRVTIVGFLSLSLLGFWYFSLLEKKLEIILSLSLVENLDLLASLQVLSPLIVNFYWLLYGFACVVKYVSAMPVLLLLSNSFVSGIVIRGFYSSLIGLDILSFLLEAGKQFDSSSLMFRVIGVKSSFASLVAERPSTTSFLKEVSMWEKPRSNSFHITRNRTFFEKEAPWEEVRRKLPFFGVERFMGTLPLTETTLHHKLLAMLFGFREQNFGEEENFKKVLADLNIDSVKKANAYGFKISQFNEIAKLSVKDINAADLSNVRSQKAYARKLLVDYPSQDIAQCLHYILPNRTYPNLILTATWQNTFPLVKQVLMPKTAQLVQFQFTAHTTINEVNSRFYSFDKARETHASFQNVLLRYNEVIGISAAELAASKMGNPIIDLQPASGIGKGDVIMNFVNGESVNLELTQIKNAFLYPYFEDWSLEKKNRYFFIGLGKAILDKHVISEAKVYVHIGFTQQLGEEIHKALVNYLSDARVVLQKSYSEEQFQVNNDLEQLQQRGVSASQMNDKKLRLHKIEKKRQTLACLCLNSALKNTIITTSENFKK